MPADAEHLGAAARRGHDDLRGEEPRGLEHPHRDRVTAGADREQRDEIAARAPRRGGERRVEGRAQRLHRAGLRRVVAHVVPPEAPSSARHTLEERVAREPAAEEEDTRAFLPCEQYQRPGELAAGELEVAGALREEAEVEARHRERRIQVERVPVVIRGRGDVARVLAAERAQVMRLGVQLVALEDARADALGAGDVAARREEDRAQEQRVDVVLAGRRPGAEGGERVGEPLALQELERERDARAVVERGRGRPGARAAWRAAAVTFATRSDASWIAWTQDAWPPCAAGAMGAGVEGTSAGGASKAGSGAPSSSPRDW